MARSLWGGSIPSEWCRVGDWSAAVEAGGGSGAASGACGGAGAVFDAASVAVLPVAVTWQGLGLVGGWW